MEDILLGLIVSSNAPDVLKGYTVTHRIDVGRPSMKPGEHQVCL